MGVAGFGRQHNEDMEVTQRMSAVGMVKSRAEKDFGLFHRFVSHHVICFLRWRVLFQTDALFALQVREPLERLA